MNGMIEWMARNGVAANLLMATILLLGITTFPGLSISVFPEVQLDQVQIQVAYPGASPAEIEESIIRRIEDKIDTVEEIQEVTATASEGMGTVNVELVRGADTQRRLDEIKSEIDQIITFPLDAEEPQVRQMTNQQRAIQLVIAGNASERDLKEMANRVKDDLTAMEAISIANVGGTRNYEISIEVSSDALRSQNLTLTDLSAAVARESLELPGGEIETSREELVLRTLGRNYDQQDFSEIVVLTNSNGTQLRLGDIAEVNDGFADTDLINLYNGLPAVSVSVMKVGNEQVLDIEETVLEYLDSTLRPMLPEGVVAFAARNDAVNIRDRLEILGSNALMGLVLVIITLTLFLELRIAMWTSLGILISFVGVFIIMDITDTSINALSSMGFLLAIGIVVDDAIVVGENIFARYEAGMSPLQAAIKGAQRIAVPVIFAVGTTIAAFASLLTLPGTIGGLLADIPVIVIGVLFISVAEALLVLPYHLSHVNEKAGRKKEKGYLTRKIDAIHKSIGRGFKMFIDGPLDKSLHFVTLHPWAAICSAISLLMLTAGILAGGFVKFNFFPAIEGEYVTASIELPTGATVERTQAVVDRVETAINVVEAELQPLMDDEYQLITSVNVIVGAQDSAQPDPLGAGGGLTQPNVATIIVQLIGPEFRDFSSGIFADRWREIVGEVPEVRKLTYSSDQMSFGDPVGVELTAADDLTLDTAVTEVENGLRQLVGVFDVRNDRDTGKKEITFSLKPEARNYGLTLQSLAFQVRAAFFGDESLRVQRGEEDVRVYIRLPKDERNSLDDLSQYRIRTPQGFVPLGEVADLQEGVSPTSIQRRNGRRIIAVTSNLDTDILTSNEVNSYISTQLMPPLQARFPDLTYDFGGEQREQARTGPAIIKNFFLALVAIYAMLAIAFKSYIQPLIVLSVIPFGIVGAITGHLIMGINMSLLSVFGMIGLSGVIINGALVMIDFINEERRNGVEARLAIIEGAKGRFRPIFLTALTTFLGVGPLIFETSVQAQFLIPVALSVGFGVLFGTALQLLLVPALMSIYKAPVLKPEISHSGVHLDDGLRDSMV